MNRIKKMKNYTYRFIHDESGMELLQFAIGLVITVALIGAVMILKDVVENNILKASDEANEQMGSLLGDE